MSLLTIPAFACATQVTESVPSSEARTTPVLAALPAVIDWTLATTGRSGIPVRLSNLSAEPLVVEASLREWHFDEDGALLDSEPGEAGFAARVRVVPQRIALDPGQRRTLRLWLEDAAGLAAGEHRALLVLRGRDSGGRQRIRLDLAVYAQLGPALVEARLDSVQWHVCDGMLHAAFTVANLGNRHVRMEGWIRADGLERTALPRTPVLPGERRVLHLRIPVGEGSPASVRLEGVLGRLVLDDFEAERIETVRCGEDIR